MMTIKHRGVTFALWSLPGTLIFVRRHASDIYHYALLVISIAAWLYTLHLVSEVCP